MSLQARLNTLIQAIGTDTKAILTSRGTMASLTTTEKTNLVGAINELKTLIDGVVVGAIIDDAAIVGDVTHVFSADKVLAQLAALKAEILGGASAAWDTLQEIATWAETNDTAISGLLTAVGNRVSYADVQSLTAPQQAQACANIGVGDPETDLVAIYNTAKA